METKNKTWRDIAECLHLLADIITTENNDNFFPLLKKNLLQTKKDLLANKKNGFNNRQLIDEGQITVASQESSSFEKNNSFLSIKEYGQDVTSDIEFPTRNALKDFALNKGVHISKSDSKATIRKRLLEKAELRNMDIIIGEITK